MANRLSDDELRRSLLELGEDVGPITSTTRNIYEKKLISLRKSPRSNHGLNALSSDDSEIEAADNSRLRKKRSSSSQPVVPTGQLKRLSLNRSRESSSPFTDPDVFKKPSPGPVKVSVHGKKNAFEGSILRANLDTRAKPKKNQSGIFSGTAFDVETSDSDFDSDGQLISRRTLRLRKKHSPPETLREIFKPRRRKKFPLNAEQSNTDLSGGRLSSSYDSSWSIDSHLNHGHTFNIDSEGDHKQDSFNRNGYLSNIITNGDFHEEKVQGLSTNYSHCVSWMLVLGTIAFFVVIGALYMTEVQKNTQSANENYSALKFCNGISEDQCKTLLEVSHELHNLLSIVAGEYECGIGNRKNRNLSLLEAKIEIQKTFDEQQSFESESKLLQSEEFDFIFNRTISLIHGNPEWGIKLDCKSVSGDSRGFNEVTASVRENSCYLEAKHAAKPFWCRVKQSIQWTGTKLLIIFLAFGIAFVVFFAIKFWKKRRDAQEKLFYELIEKVIDILQESPCQSDSSAGPCRVVNHVRDMLISPKERKEKQWLWDRVEAFIEENESRVRVEYDNIADENCKIWRWLSASTSENAGGKQGKVWQGQAFNSLGKERNATYSLTPCLKIRNMFDPEVEYGTDWQVSVKDAILEKCEGNEGIIHIAVDTSSHEGCVYLLCVSSEAAGDAFNALHGWWFDGKLVTVKYLRYEKYVERFPSAQFCKEPLKPSNNKRLSLSTPFFSSALERS